MFDTGMQKKSEKERKKIIFSFAPRPQFLQRKIFHMVRTHGQAEEFSQMQVVFVKQSLVAKKMTSLSLYLVVVHFLALKWLSWALPFAAELCFVFCIFGTLALKTVIVERG